PSGGYYAIIGHTGSGKSTMIQHLNGLLQPTNGTVQIGEHLISAGKKEKKLKPLRKKVGVVFQFPEHQLFEETVEKDI
ncbi:ATP-binding cassette domain-containing protein, partial [Acinetobacter baumannii]